VLDSFRGKEPQIHPTAFIAPTAVLIGDVLVEENASVWYGAVLRGDMGAIRVGQAANVQDNCVVHSQPGKDVIIGERATIGHAAILHGCTVKRGSLVGMGAVVLEGAIIGEQSVVAAGSVVVESMNVPDRHLVAGSPAAIKKELGPTVGQALEQGVEEYLALTRAYLHGR
jgi:carbonic anhydrase/acetyltransferase-like protein (isoleucine patch superfamily)